MQAPEIVLSSGSSLTPEAILEAVLLLARSESPFPLLSPKDVQRAVLLLLPSIIEFNDERAII